MEYKYNEWKSFKWENWFWIKNRNRSCYSINFMFCPQLYLSHLILISYWPICIDGYKLSFKVGFPSNSNKVSIYDYDSKKERMRYLKFGKSYSLWWTFSALFINVFKWYFLFYFCLKSVIMWHKNKSCLSFLLLINVFLKKIDK